MRPLAALAALLVSVSGARAQVADVELAELEGVGVTERLGESPSRDLSFRDAGGEPVTLADALRPGRPLILTLNYSTCPMLCSLQLDGLLSAMRSVDLVLGEDYEVVTVSIDPDETPAEASQARAGYLAKYNRQDVDDAWPFWTGEESAIRGLAAAVGFGYRYDESSGEYAHAAVAMVLTPEGEISRYLYGVLIEPRDLRLALVEASRGEIGTLGDRVLLYCFFYDAAEGGYVLHATRLMKVAGAVTVVVLAAFLAALWRADRRRARTASEGGAEASATGSPKGTKASP